MRARRRKGEPGSSKASSPRSRRPDCLGAELPRRGRNPPHFGAGSCAGGHAAGGKASFLARRTTHRLETDARGSASLLSGFLNELGGGRFRTPNSRGACRGSSLCLPQVGGTTRHILPRAQSSLHVLVVRALARTIRYGLKAALQTENPLHFQVLHASLGCKLFGRGPFRTLVGAHLRVCPFACRCHP